MILTRRQLAQGAGALALAGCATTGGGRRLGLGLADITVSKELARDYAGTLARIAALGYRRFGFRLSGWDPRAPEPTPADKARMVRDAGLEVGVVRLGVRGADWDRQVGEAAAIGARIVALTTAPVFISGRAIGSTTREAFDRWLPELAALGAKCRAAGLTLAYHNHAWDLVPLGGEAPLDIMARSIPPSDLSFEIDLAWAWHAGVAPLDLLARLGPRVASMHFKDVDRSRGTSTNEIAVVIGRGAMGWEALLPRIARLTSAPAFVEVDAAPDGLAAAADAMAFVRLHGKEY